MASYNEFTSTYPYVLRKLFSIIFVLVGGSVRVLAIHDVELALDLGDQIVEHVGGGRGGPGALPEALPRGDGRRGDAVPRAGPPGQGEGQGDGGEAARGGDRTGVAGPTDMLRETSCTRFPEQRPQIPMVPS